MSFEYFDILLPEDKGRYLEKLKLAGLDDCPYKLPADRWINDPKQWPAIEYGDVYNYLIKSPGLYSMESMENYRSLDAHVFFLSGWVQTIEHTASNSGLLVFKADVKPSYRVTDDPHHPWLVLKSTGQVVAAHCDCTAGCGETCSHVGAMLFKLEAGVRLGYTSSACTDVACIWNECFVKNVTPAMVGDIKFYKASKERCQQSKKRCKPAHPPATVDQQQQLNASLSTLGNKVVGLSTFLDYAGLFSGRGPVPRTWGLPKAMSTLYSKGNELLEQQAISDLCASSSIKVLAEEVADVEEATREQASSRIWHEQRHGRITASVAADCLRTNIQSPAPSLLRRICDRNVKKLYVPALSWGNEHEEDGFRLFANVMAGEGPPPKTAATGKVFLVGKYHDELHVKKSGLVLCEDKPHLGASPDGIVSGRCCGNGVLEIKCPFKHRSSPLTTAFADGQFCLDKAYQLKADHGHYVQLQMQMFVCGVQHGFLVVWTPVDSAIVLVPRNEHFIQEIIVKLDCLWKTAVLPELLTRQLEKSVAKPCASSASTSTSQPESESKVYCLCRTTTDLANMVGCDQCDNWFHLKCLKLKRFPTGKTWYCKTCRKGKKV